MTTIEVPYSILVNTEAGGNVPINLYDFATTTADIRQQWVKHIIRDLQPSHGDLQAIRAYKIVLDTNGAADVHTEPTLPVEEHRYVYPVRFWLPRVTVKDRPLEEQVGRAEMFALGSLLYHIYSGHKPFHNLPDQFVEACFANAKFPDDTLDLDQWPMILSCWSLEFARDLHATIPRKSHFFLPDLKTGRPAKHELIYIQANANLGDRLLNHVKAHPYLSALQASGALLGAASLGAPLILGVAGFGALGPVAGSVAAGWQSSMGLVQAGSFFAWCQSAAMGGAAASGIVAAGAVGAGVAAGATVAGFVTKDMVGNMTEEQVREMYDRAFLRGPEVEKKKRIEKQMPRI